jgi:hypothetical protein
MGTFSIAASSAYGKVQEDVEKNVIGCPPGIRTPIC